MKCCNVKPNLVNHALCRPLFFSKKLSKFLMCFVICLNINQYLNLFLHYSSTTRTEGKLTKWPVSWLSTNWLLAKKSLPEWFLYTNGGGGQLPRQVHDKSSPLGPGLGNCLKQSCPRGMRVGQMKNNFSLILQIMCYFLHGLHEAAEFKTTYFQGKMPKSGWRGINYQD